MLKKIMGTVSNFVIVVSLVVLAGFSVMSFFNTNNAKEKIAELNLSVQKHSQEIRVLNETNRALTEENKGLIERINKLREDTQANSIAIEDGVAAAKELAANRPEAPEECAQIIEHMGQEIEQWKENFSLAIKDRDTWKSIAGDFNLAYENQVAISVNLQKTIDMVSADSTLKDAIIKDLQKDLKVSNIKGKIAIGGVVAVVVGAVIFGLLK